MPKKYPPLEKLYSQYQKLAKKIGASPTQEELKNYGKLTRFAAIYEELIKVDKELEGTKELLNSEGEMADLAKSELDELEDKRRNLLLEAADYVSDKEESRASGVIVEIRPGTGGDEAAIFANDLLRMYLKFIESKGWKHQMISVTYTGQNGIKNASFSVDSEEAYKYLKYEAGAHRVQRVPKTEASGRIHTSVATVAVLKEVEDVSIDIKREDLEIETKRSGGPGGQHVNKTESAVRVKHKPTNIVVECESDRSQGRNRELAIKLLKAKVYDYYIQKQKSEEAKKRREQIGTGERGEKVRTYNFMQNRVTDHRINYSVHEIEKFMDGNIESITAKLLANEREQKLSNLLQN